MQFIIDFFNTLVTAVNSGFDWFVSFIQDSVYFFQQLMHAGDAVLSFFVWIPTPALVIIGTSIGVLIVLRILGRD